jgi:hypothetical protein
MKKYPQDIFSHTERHIPIEIKETFTRPILLSVLTLCFCIIFSLEAVGALEANARLDCKNALLKWTCNRSLSPRATLLSKQLRLVHTPDKNSAFFKSVTLSLMATQHSA